MTCAGDSRKRKVSQLTSRPRGGWICLQLTVISPSVRNERDETGKREVLRNNRTRSETKTYVKTKGLCRVLVTVTYVFLSIDFLRMSTDRRPLWGWRPVFFASDGRCMIYSLRSSGILAAAAGPLPADRRRRDHGRARGQPQGHAGRALGRRAVRPRRPVPVRTVRAGRRRRVDRRGGRRGRDVPGGGEREQRPGRGRSAQTRADHRRGALCRAPVRPRDAAQVQARTAVPGQGTRTCNRSTRA